MEDAERYSQKNSGTKSEFECPNVDLSSFKTALSVTDYGDTPELTVLTAPNLVPESPSMVRNYHVKYLTWTAPLVAKYFDRTTIPKNIVLIQTDSIGELGALYCRQNQSTDTLSLFISPATLASEQELLSALIHEVTHRAFDLKKLNQPRWFEEATALLMEYIYMGTPSGASVTAHLEMPNVSMITGFNDPRTSLSAYGHAQLFFIYLHNFIGDDLMTQLLNSKDLGIQAIDHIIAHTSNLPWKTFDEAFKDFEIAKRINRIDYLNTNETEQKRYFIFSSTLRSADRQETKGEQLQGPYSSITLSKAPTENQNCFFVTDSPFKEITVTDCKGRLRSEDSFFILVRTQ